LEKIPAVTPPVPLVVKVKRRIINALHLASKEKIMEVAKILEVKTSNN
jgi:hypothetical protein